MGEVPIILGIDPQVDKPAFAFLDMYGNLVTCFKLDIYDTYTIESAQHADYVCIEEQYVNLNRSGAIKLARASGIIIGMLLAFLDKDKIETVNPKTWQKLLRISPKANREQVKQRSKLFAYAITGQHIKSQDICDAITIAEWKRQKIREEYVERTASV